MTGAPPPLWRWWDLAWLLCAIFLGMVCSGYLVGLAGWSGTRENILLTLASAGVMGGASCLLLLGRAGRATAAGLVRTAPKWVLAGVLLSVVLIPILGGAALLTREILALPEEHPQAGFFLFEEASGHHLVALFLAAGIVTPFAEELLFRGVILSALREWSGDRVAIAVSSILFGLMHVEPSIVVYTTLLGVVAAVLAVRVGSIWPAVALHATNNTLTLIVMGLGETA